MDIPALLEDEAYAIIGGVATRSYMPERFTKDVDILVPYEGYERVIGRLEASGWRKSATLRFNESSLGLHGTLWEHNGASLDLITSMQPWCIKACTTPMIDALGLRIVTLPYLVLLKLDAGRTQDTADISRMLGLADNKTVEEVRDLVREHGRDNETIDDFESLLEIGRWETGGGGVG